MLHVGESPWAENRTESWRRRQQLTLTPPRAVSTGGNHCGALGITQAARTSNIYSWTQKHKPSTVYEEAQTLPSAARPEQISAPTARRAPGAWQINEQIPF